MLKEKILVALSCKLSPGAFSGERVFEVKLADGRYYTGIAPRHFCWNTEGKFVGEMEPASEDQGVIAAKVIEEIDENQMAVEVPDGEVLAVDKS